jgi:hypothetical protein
MCPQKTRMHPGLPFSTREKNKKKLLNKVTSLHHQIHEAEIPLQFMFRQSKRLNSNNRRQRKTYQRKHHLHHQDLNHNHKLLNSLTSNMEVKNTIMNLTNRDNMNSHRRK